MTIGLEPVNQGNGFDFLNQFQEKETRQMVRKL
jgi:hypothetical protein